MSTEAVVETVRGPIPASYLGKTLMHEHLFVLDPELERTYPRHYAKDPTEMVDEAVAKLEALADLGFSTLVDLTVLGLGRNIDLIQAVASRTPVNIVVATGAYVLRDLPLTLQLRGPGRTMFGGPEVLTQMFVDDIVHGIEGTNVKAGVLKCATDRFGVTKDVERTLRAVAAAHVATGVPISTHTNARSRNGLDQQRIFAEEGVDLARVVIGHCGDTKDIEYLEQLIDRGSYVGLDRFGQDFWLPLEDRIEVVKHLCRNGHAGRIVLSHDACCHNVGYTKQEMQRFVPTYGFEHLARDVVPALLDAGVTSDEIEQMLIDNPKRVLGHLPS